MDTEKAIREVIANVRLVANFLRDRRGAEHDLALQLDSIAARIQALKPSAAAGENEDDPELIADTLALVETFRDIKNPEVRKAVIRMICALRSN